MAVRTDVIATFTEDQTERLTGVSRKQLRCWDKTSFFVPSFANPDRRAACSRRYSFRDLVALRVVDTLRNEANVSLPRLREVKDKLAHPGDHLWACITPHVLSRKVIFYNPEEDVREEVVSGQAILGIPLKVISGNVESAVQTLLRRDPTLAGKIERQRITFRALLDAGAPDSVGVTLRKRGHRVILHPDILPEATPDVVVATAALENRAVLVAMDADMKRIAQR